MLPNLNIDPQEQKEILRKLDNAFSDSSIDFSTQLLNLYNGQNTLVEKYGKDGFMLLLDYETRVYADADTKRSLEIMHYADVPETCPWHGIRNLPLSKAIRAIWKAYPIDFVDSLEKYCIDLFAIYEEEKWFLAYAYETVDYNDTKQYKFLGGREPEPDAQFPKPLLQAGWKMPQDLQALYAVHGNFGDLKSAIRNDDTHCLSSAEKLETSLAFLEEYVEKWNVDYSFFDLLPFCEDGSGNSQNFYKAMPDGDSYTTVDWDHETKQISASRALEDFIDDQFGQNLRGDY